MIKERAFSLRAPAAALHVALQRSRAEARTRSPTGEVARERLNPLAGSLETRKACCVIASASHERFNALATLLEAGPVARPFAVAFEG
ncbi:MAG: hypothetical protein C4334_08685 [Pyrinomonas sp.]